MPRGQGQGLLFELTPNMQYRSYLNTGRLQSAEWTGALAEGYMGEALDSLFYGDVAGRYRANFISSLYRENTYAWNSLSADARATGDVQLTSDGLTFDLGGSFRHDILNATVRYMLWQNALVQAMTYDPSTGVRTYRPEGIDGNWNVHANQSYRLPQDKKRRINLSTNTTADYRNSVDLLALSTETESLPTTVRRTLFRENLSLGYTQGPYRLTVTGGLEWTHSESDRFPALNAMTYSYGLNGSAPLPWGFHLTNAITVYRRTGYTDARFNTTQPIWNASLSRSILHGRLHLQLEAFDLLNRMSAYSYTINAQQQVESYRNVLRRYVMLNLTWCMNREPRKK